MEYVLTLNTPNGDVVTAYRLDQAASVFETVRQYAESGKSFTLTMRLA